MPSVAQVESPGIGPRKTLFIMVTVVGCIAILWPKVFYPMMFGATPKQTLVKDHRGTGCCDVVLDRESFMNETLAGPQLYRKRLNLFTGEISLRQERPPHLRPDSIHPAMRERGRAIPSTQTIPVVERAKSTQPPPRIVEGRPGPIPGMRPPMGAGSVHQAQPKGSSMGLIMPLYTVGIIAFFIYTLMKIVFKKQVPNAPYGPVRPDPTFRREVFGQESNDIPRRPQPTRGPQIGCNHHHHVHDSCNCGQKHANGEISSSYSKRSSQQIVANPTATNIGMNGNGISATAGRHYGHIGQIQEREQLMEIEKLRKKLEETEKAMAILIAEMNCDRYKAKETPENVAQTENISNGHATAEDSNDISSKLAETGENLKDKNENLEKSDEIHNGKSEKEINDGGAASLQDETERILKEAIEEIKREKIRDSKKESDDFIKHEKPSTPRSERKKREGSGDRAAMVLGMELTASCEGGHKWGRPPTPVFISHHEHSHEDEIDKPEPQSIYLEGSLPHESQILVSDAETRTENVIDDDINGSPDEPAVVLSSKMTLSLINLCSSSTEEDEIEEDKKSGSPEEKEDSPLDEDMEIINGDEKEVDKVKKQESTEEE